MHQLRWHRECFVYVACIDLGMTCIILNFGLYISPIHLLCFQETLQKDFGSKTGSMLWNYSRGIDDRLVGMIQVRTNTDFLL